ncbi:DUF3667 domain-containing protein [Niabella digestorum]|uniref:DUF3667 domain-containing protein n=1 Tax=Niabella digestorum TaxID=3117701 RepID=A0ABU7RH75_9BACT
MRHHLRKEKQCLNCGQEVEERFCTHCGQENIEPHDSLWHLIAHYFQDLVHYDNRFWHTFKNLFTQPGFVAKEYLEGKRVRNLKPIQLYVFASTVFFIVFSFVKHTDYKPGTDIRDFRKRLYNLEREKEYLKDFPQAVYVDSVANAIKQQQQTLRLKDENTTADSALKQTLKELQDEGISLGGDAFKVQISRDSANKKASGVGKKRGWLSRKLKDVKNQKLQEQYEGDEKRMIVDLVENLKKKLPLIFFLSLPFFAFFLWLLHRRKTKKTYVENFIFSVYQYAYVFVIGLFTILLGYVFEKIFSNHVAETLTNWLNVAVFVYLFLYLTFSMKRFFGQSFRRAFFKQLIVCFLTSVLVGFLTAGVLLVLYIS